MKRPMVEGDRWRLDVILERKAVSLHRKKSGVERSWAGGVCLLEAVCVIDMLNHRIHV